MAIELLLVKGIIAIVKSGGLKTFAASLGKIALTQGVVQSIQIGLLAGTVFGGIVLTESIILHAKAFIQSALDNDPKRAAKNFIALAKNLNAGYSVASDLVLEAAAKSSLSLSQKKIVEVALKELKAEGFKALEASVASDRINGTQLPGHKNVLVSHPGAKPSPAPGYSWVNPNTPGDYRVRWSPKAPHPHYPNVIASRKERKWVPAPGYLWVNPGPKNDFRVVSKSAAQSRKKEVKEFIKATIQEKCNARKGKIKGKTSLLLLDLKESDVEFVRDRVNEKFRISLKKKDIKKCTYVNDIAALVNRKLE